jgi:hypothetical protein
LTVSQAVPPPAISGGTLIVTADGATAVAADPDRDHVYLVDLAGPSLRADVALQQGDEPGRIALDGAQHAHVVLRGAGAVATVDLATAAVVDRTSVCPAPRGIAWEAATDRIHVACAGGELVSLPAAGGAPARSLLLDRDLRDVIVDGDHLLVSRFRAAEVLSLDASGAIVDRMVSPPMFAPGLEGSGGVFQPAVGWRLVSIGDAGGGGGLMAQLHAEDGPVVIGQGGYGDGLSKCGTGTVVHATANVYRRGQSVVAGPALPGVLPVDVAVSAAGDKFAYVMAGEAHVPVMFNVVGGDVQPLLSGSPCPAPTQFLLAPGQPTAIAFLPSGDLVVQSREPATLTVFRSGAPFATVPLSTVSREDTGHSVFHSDSGAGIACASCHPEGGDDGRVWNFDPIGQRRTQNLRGGLLATAPFHWDGDLRDVPSLMHEVFEKRMSGPALASDQLGALASWLDARPALPHAPAPDAAAVARGRALFEDTAGAGCVSCHSGAHYTNNATLDVGTGKALQVPTLIGLAFRAPYLHDGCAATLRDRFVPSGSGACAAIDTHGMISQLTSSQIDDLVAFLDTL